MRTLVGLGLCLLAIASCTTKRAGSGDACTRSTQCAAGLACIERVCSNDLDALRDQSVVPVMTGAGRGAAGETGISGQGGELGPTPPTAGELGPVPPNTDEDAG